MLWCLHNQENYGILILYWNLVQEMNWPELGQRFRNLSESQGDSASAFDGNVPKACFIGAEREKPTPLAVALLGRLSSVCSGWLVACLVARLVGWLAG